MNGMTVKKILKMFYITALIFVLTTIFILSNQDGIKSNSITSSISGKFSSLIKQTFNSKYIKLTRKDGRITAFYSTYGLLWWKIGDSIDLNLARKIYMGLAVTSHNTEALCGAVFSDVKVTSRRNSIRFLNYESKDIGKVKLKGSTSFLQGEFIVKGSGKDIWRGEDEFQFAYIPVEDDCTITTRVVSMDNTHEWAKAGIIMRDSLQPKSSYAGVLMTPGGHTSFQWRNQNELGQKLEYSQSLLLNYLLRKILHFTEYFILTLLVYGTITIVFKNSCKKVFLTGAFCILYAVSDEIHQIFIPNRNSSVYDVLIDSLGVLIGTFMVYLYRKRKNSKFKNKKSEQDTV
ncbi:VanZ family protein [Ruminiclostridium josui]|uniref:VanZ family protein n=1 Tax=Ruminiclostridium josui TaxID=1499 RepID=UPI000464D430|nr:VanZ family protein [Ruminiclostridium josui]